MDWATFFKDYPAIVPAIATVLAAILGFFFVRWNSTHNKNLDLQKKDFDRRASNHARQIQEARDTLEKWTSFSYYSRETLRTISVEKDFQSITHRLESYDEEFKKIPSMRHEAIIRESSIEMLEDKELSNLQTKLFLTLGIVLKNLRMIDNNLRTIEGNLKLGNTDISDITENVNFEEAEKAFEEANKIITHMKIRLNKLSQTVP